MPSKLAKLVTIKKMKTFSAKAEDIDRAWYVIDAADQILGQVAEKAARLLRGLSLIHI